MKKILISITPPLLIGLLLIYWLHHHLYCNFSKSEPRGYYLSYTPKAYQIGDRVLVCIDNKTHVQILHNLGLPFENTCPNQMPYLIKTIVAKSGDVININKNGIYINNKLYPQSQISERFPHLINGQFKLKPHEYFLLGQSLHSYDSRYFGIILESQIKHKVILIYSLHF